MEEGMGECKASGGSSSASKAGIRGFRGGGSSGVGRGAATGVAGEAERARPRICVNSESEVGTCDIQALRYCLLCLLLPFPSLFLSGMPNRHSQCPPSKPKPPQPPDPLAHAAGARAVEALLALGCRGRRRRIRALDRAQPRLLPRGNLLPTRAPSSAGGPGAHAFRRPRPGAVRVGRRRRHLRAPGYGAGAGAGTANLEECALGGAAA